MIGTLPATSNPRRELRERLDYLITGEIPRLEAEVTTESEIALVALEQARQEAHDIATLLVILDSHRARARSEASVVRLNDLVTVRAARSRTSETMIVHDRDLQIRARGFISVASPLGSAVIGRPIGESVRVRCNGGISPRFVIEKVECA